MLVAWNRHQEDFPTYWLWQFGEGPFEVLDSYPVRSTPAHLGTGTQQVTITFDPGVWYTIAVPNAALQYRVEYGIRVVTFFHEKWFTVLEA